MWWISFLGSLYISWGGEGGYCIKYYIKDGIQNQSFYEMESYVFVALEIEVESMEVSCTLIPIMENG